MGLKTSVLNLRNAYKVYNIPRKFKVMDFCSFKLNRKHIIFLVIIILDINIQLVSSQTMVGRVITTLQGDVRGRTSRTRNGRLFTEYWGIPYAEKPKRFERAKPAQSWEGIKECSKKPPACYFQTDDCHPQGSEDCLFINVHTSVTHHTYFKKELPVIVIIHGGFEHYSDQTGHYLGAKYFLDKEIVLVTFNYRLGVFGFLSTQDDTISANNGLRDQVLALKWVKNNIKFFGGNPDSVTLLGYGSGASSVHLHTLSPMSKGLFHKVIMQAGNAANPWAIVDDPEKSYIRLASAMKCENCDSAAVVKCLRAKQPWEILQAIYDTQYLFSENRDEIGNIFFGPVVEHWMRGFPDTASFLSNYPQNILLGNDSSNQAFKDLPMLIGNNQYDGVTKAIAEIVDKQMTKSKARVDWSIPVKTFGKFFSYSAKLKPNQTAGMDKAIDKFYFKSKGQKGIRKDNGLTFFNALSHRNYFQGTRDTAFIHAKHSSSVFLYYMTYFRQTSFLEYWMRGFNTRYDMVRKKRTTLQGPVNGDELQYLFDLDEMGDFPLIRKIYREVSIGFSNNLILMWVNFAKTSIPATDWKPLPKGVDKKSITWYQIGDKRVTIPAPFNKELNFWDKSFPFKTIELSSSHSSVAKHQCKKEWDDLIYIDGTGDDDGTGGLFELITGGKIEKQPKNVKRAIFTDENRRNPEISTVEKTSSDSDNANDKRLKRNNPENISKKDEDANCSDECISDENSVEKPVLVDSGEYDGYVFKRPVRKCYFSDHTSESPQSVPLATSATKTE